MIAALYVAEDGPYTNIEGIIPFTALSDARLYVGPFPVIAHPPCERWGRYWSGGPSAKVRRRMGDDDGCFAAALTSVRIFGGVLEHPAHSHAWKRFALTPPPKEGGWIPDGIGWSCHVEQGHYGHPARKATWLYYCGVNKPPELTWGPSKGIRLDEGFHSAEERRRARAAGVKPIKRLSKKECIHTPVQFRDLLIQLAKDSK